jgi:succinate dehydrogenase / fumarate reductase flavoprotein subunit
MTKGKEIVQRLQEEAKTAYIDDRGTVFNQDVLGALELGFMLDCSEAIVTAALERKESRGAHSRTDFTERNDEDWLFHLTVSQDGEGADAPAKLDKAPITFTQWEPMERTY